MKIQVCGTRLIACWSHSAGQSHRVLTQLPLLTDAVADYEASRSKLNGTAVSDFESTAVDCQEMLSLLV